MEEGSFSVEAALVMPIVIFAVLSLIFYSFYLRDIVFIETVGRSALFEENGPDSKVAGTDDRQADNEELMVLINECLWWGMLTKWEPSKDADYIEYEISANIFGFRTAANNIIMVKECKDTPDRLRLFKSITEEAGELIFTGGSTDGG